MGWPPFEELSVFGYVEKSVRARCGSWQAEDKCFTKIRIEVRSTMAGGLVVDESAGEIPAVLRSRLKMWHYMQPENFDYLLADDSKLHPDVHHTCL